MITLFKHLEMLRQHSCAYCGSIKTKINGIEITSDYLRPNILCDSCHQTDIPMILMSDFLKFAREVG